MPPPSKYANYGKTRYPYTTSPPFTRTPHATPAECTIEWDTAAQQYSVSTLYHQNFVEFIKAKIPGNDRMWDAASKKWFVKEKYIDILKDFALMVWPTQGAVSFTSRASIEDAERLRFEQEQQAILASLPPRERSYYEFLSALPWEAMQAAFRKAATLLHPDITKDNGEAMTKLNTAWAKLQKEVNAK